MDSLKGVPQIDYPGGMEQKCTTVTFRIFQKRRLVYAQNGKNPLTDYVTDSMTEAVFYPCFGVVYGRFRVDFTQKWENFGYFSGK